MNKPCGTSVEGTYAAKMPSPMEGIATAMAGYDSSSGEEDSTSPETSPEPTLTAERFPGTDDSVPIASVHLDASVQENSPKNSIDPLESQVIMHARAYQVEMFEKSLKQNIIVAMDTGSGKTQVAVLRIQAELEKPSDKIVWFLAPTIALCEQQFRVLKSQLGTSQIKILSGSDGIDSWSDTRIWDDYLKDVRVVVSTYQVLLDAVTHAFVKMDRLCLIVFDEGKHINLNLT